MKWPIICFGLLSIGASAMFIRDGLKTKRLGCYFLSAFFAARGITLLGVAAVEY